MARGSIGDNIGLAEEIITKACGLAFKSHKSPEKFYFYEKVRISPNTYHVFSFPGSFDDADWFVKKPFGETKIDLTKFPSLRSVGNDEAALVNEGFAKRFDQILEKTSFKSEVCNSQYNL